MRLLLCCEGYRFEVLTRSQTLSGIMVSSLHYLNHATSTLFYFVYTKHQDVLDGILQYLLTLPASITHNETQ